MMRGLIQEEISSAAEAYLAWWRIAGVDCAIDESPVNWLHPASASAPNSVSASKSAAKPTTLDEFRTWLLQDPDQPEHRWAGAPLLPPAVPGAPIMIIVDMPDAADIAAGTLLADKAGQLLDAMLAAIGISRDQVQLASLFLSRPPGGMVETSDLVIAASRMRTHVALAAPRVLLLLGDRTVRALLSECETTRNDLHNFNHDEGTVSAFAAFHPRLLLGQPAAKAECWRTLQKLIEEMLK